LIKENVYGHGKRLEWILSHLRRSDATLEFGCGTGMMITIPLALMGYSVSGMDADADSIAFGKARCQEAGVDPGILRVGNLPGEVPASDVIIVSEVLEHVSDGELDALLPGLGKALNEGGTLLVTVPNGYGWFELESFLWYRAGLGKAVEFLRADRAIRKLKRILLGRGVDAHYHDTPSTLSSSPHIQRFTLRSIRRLLERHGFEVVDVHGSVMFSGPFSNLLFTGVNTVMALNSYLGGHLSAAAASFYLACRQSRERGKGASGTGGAHGR
jgi:SAM-dependent methyltransferase